MTDTPVITPREAALGYAARGWLVFPTHGLRAIAEEDGRLVCTCGEAGCDRAGKHPASVAPRGLVDATRTPSRIEAWWSAGANWNVSIRTGRASDLYVVDVSAIGEGPLDDLEREHGPLPDTLTSRSGTRGRHLYFRYPSHGTWRNTRQRLGPGIDTRGESGWVIAPPSLHKSGAQYEWSRIAPVADMPAWLLDLLRPGAGSGTTSTVPGGQLVDALADDTVEEAPEIDMLADTTWRPDPYTAAAGSVVGDDVRPALRALADTLARWSVRPDSIVAAIRNANESNCRPALSSDEAEDVAYSALADEDRRQAKLNDERARQVDPQTVAGQRQLAQLRRRTRVESPVPAVRAYLLAHLSIVDYDAGSQELSVVWHETRETVQLPIGGSDRELQPAVTRLFGNLGAFAHRAHDKAKGAMILTVLQELARVAPARQVEQEDSEPVQLVDAILTLDIWEHEQSGGYSRPTPAMLVAREGFHEASGLGFVKEDGRRLLVANMPRLASGVFAKNAQFRAKKSRDLQKIFEEAPGYVGQVRIREVRKALGDLMFHGIDMGEFLRITGRAPALVPRAVQPELRLAGATGAAVAGGSR